jgi:hypothetical protein
MATGMCLAGGILSSWDLTLDMGIVFNSTVLLPLHGSVLRCIFDSHALEALLLLLVVILKLTLHTDTALIGCQAL